MRSKDDIIGELESLEGKYDPEYGRVKRLNHDSHDDVMCAARLQLEVLLDIRELLSRMAPRDWVTYTPR
jgi:hypothetical protein